MSFRLFPSEVIQFGVMGFHSSRDKAGHSYSDGQFKCFKCRWQLFIFSLWNLVYAAIILGLIVTLDFCCLCMNTLGLLIICFPKHPFFYCNFEVIYVVFVLCTKVFIIWSCMKFSKLFMQKLYLVELVQWLSASVLRIRCLAIGYVFLLRGFISLFFQNCILVHVACVHKEEHRPRGGSSVLFLWHYSLILLRWQACRTVPGYMPAQSRPLNPCGTS